MWFQSQPEVVNMLVLGLILLVVGAVVLYLVGGDRFARLAGVILLALGLIFVIVGAFDAADVRIH